MAKSLVDFIWEQESYSGLVELPISKVYNDENGDIVPVVLKLRRPGSVELLAYMSRARDLSYDAIPEATAVLAVSLLEDPNLSDPRMLAKYDAKTPLEAASRWIGLKDLAGVVGCVAKIVKEESDKLAQESDDAKNS